MMSRLPIPRGGPAACLAAALALLLAACNGADVSYDGVEDTIQTPQGRFEPDIDDPARQTIFGSGGVSGLFTDDRGQGGAGLGVNALLWRAALDVLAFLPLTSADPLGGTVIYDWYAPPESPGERFKATVYILDTRLTATALRVGLHRQRMGEDGWREAAVSDETVRALEDAILTRARQLRIARLGQ